MTKSEAETLAILSERVSIMAKQLDQNTHDTAAIKSTLDNLSGGRQALMWFTGLAVSVILAIATWIGVTHK